MKPAGRASRGVTDLLERGQGEHRHLCFHNARRRELVAFSSSYISAQIGDDVQSSLEESW